MVKKRKIILGLLAVLVLLLHLFSLNSQLVETYYSLGVYPSLSRTLRFLFGVFPFSLGDVLYGFAAIFLLWKLISTFIKLKSLPSNKYRPYLKSGLYNLFGWILSIYLIFNLFWGLNYNRPGVQHELGIKPEQYSKADLLQINELLLQKVNLSREEVASGKGFIKDPQVIFNTTRKAVAAAAQEMPFLNARHVVIKPSLWRWLGNSAGFTGYYNPFTGEAQVNTDYPNFILPYVSCHEVAHQAGYAKEMEANFVGYLYAVNAHQPAFDYSVYIDLFLYANRNLYYADSTTAMNIRKKLDPLVINDLEELHDFMSRHQNFAEPVIRWIYTAYLRGNEQPEGMLSYDKVTGFIIGYYKKFGKI